MDGLTRKLRHLVDKEMKLRKQIVACVKEVNKREVWKEHGFKSVRQFCRENLKYADWDLRSVMMGRQACSCS